MLNDKNLNRYFKKYALFLFIGILANIFVDYIQLFIPEFLGQVVYIAGSSNPEITEIEKIVFKVVLVGLGLFVGRIIMRFCILSTSNKIESGLRKDMFEKATRLSTNYYHNTKAGNILSWFSSDLESIEEFTGWGTITLIDAVFLSTMSIIKMIRLDWVMALITIIPMMLLIIWGFLVERTMSNKWDERQSCFDKLYDFVSESFTGIRVIKAFVKDVQEKRAFIKVCKENSDKNIEYGRLSVLFDVLIEVILGLITGVVFGLGSYFIYCYIKGNPVIIFNYEIKLTPDRLTTFVGYMDTLVWPMIAMGQIVQMRSKAKACLKRIGAFLDQEEEIHNKEDAVVLDKAQGSIEFKDFSFKYPDSKNKALDNISFKIKKGEMIGIVGKVGSGKTTLVNCLLRLYNVNNNSLYIDGLDIMDLDIESLRDNIAYVPQDNFLFSDNIANNIAFSNKKLDMSRIRSAAKFSDVDENIMSFASGYNTITGERGVSLSGGQKQRIAIARAYVKEAPIMIIDDGVSAVDMSTEETILHNIYEKRRGKTTIIIASRVSTIMHMDKVLVLDRGKVEAFDTVDNLLKNSETFKKMVYLQKLESEL